MSFNEQKLVDLKEKVRKTEEVKIRLEEKIKYLQVEKEKLLAELQGYGVTPETVDSYLQQLDAEINNLTNSIETSLPVIPKELLNAN